MCVRGDRWEYRDGVLKFVHERLICCKADLCISVLFFSGFCNQEASVYMQQIREEPVSYV
jgi:hypothetical protein